jgi:hypothetical protein
MFPQDNIFKIYYRTGRTLPLEVRRYPRGYSSEWYDNQSVLVTEIKPRGEYGEAWGFYLQNGERADSYWCSKDVEEPQPIPCCGCGGWILASEKIGDTPVETAKPDFIINKDLMLKATDKMKFGKYKGKTLAEVKSENESYLKWAEEKVAGFFIDWDSFT